MLLIIVPQSLTPTLVFRRLPPDSATLAYATERALYLGASVHRHCQRPHKDVSTNKTESERSIESRHARPPGIREARLPGIKKKREEFCLD